MKNNWGGGGRGAGGLEGSEEGHRGRATSMGATVRSLMRSVHAWGAGVGEEGGRGQGDDAGSGGKVVGGRRLRGEDKGAEGPWSSC